jgi:hypothetical protein
VIPYRSDQNGGDDGSRAGDLASSARLRALARRERNTRAATRMLAIAGALDGMTRTEAARMAGMERQGKRRGDGTLRRGASL